jgi:hypothetical protein
MHGGEKAITLMGSKTILHPCPTLRERTAGHEQPHPVVKRQTNSANHYETLNYLKNMQR